MFPCPIHFLKVSKAVLHSESSSTRSWRFQHVFTVATHSKPAPTTGAPDFTLIPKGCLIFSCSPCSPRVKRDGTLCKQLSNCMELAIVLRLINGAKPIKQSFPGANPANSAKSLCQSCLKYGPLTGALALLCSFMVPNGYVTIPIGSILPGPQK